jgi:putative SOS response-associated peptidase YedK
MCGRATLVKPLKELEDRLQAKLSFPEEMVAEVLPNYNIAPTHSCPVVTNDHPSVIQFFRWGLIPFWAKDAKIGSRLINARIETVLEKPSFRGIKYRRCLVPFDGFYEWKREGKIKQPYRITLTDESIFCVAGTWESWHEPLTGNTIFTFTLLTMEPNEMMAEIHNRMPAILLPEQEKDWLNGSVPIRDLVDMIHPYPAELMQAHPVSTRVNKVSENDADLLRSIE